MRDLELRVRNGVVRSFDGVVRDWLEELVGDGVSDDIHVTVDLDEVRDEPGR